MDRLSLLEAAFLIPPRADFDPWPRPFSVGSLPLCRALGITIALGDPPADEFSIEEQCVVYSWAHNAPLPEVLTALRTPDATGAAIARYSLLELGNNWTSAAVLAELSANAALIEAASVEIREKPRAPGAAARSDDRDPPDIVEPCFVASLVYTLLSTTTLSEHQILWELPFARALQYRHCAWRSNLAWTVAPSSPVTLAAADDQYERLRSNAFKDDPEAGLEF